MRPFYNLEPGLEMDKLIAKEVLGWHQDGDGDGPPRSWWFKKDGSGPLHLNHFSADIKAAWDLVDRFELCISPWIEEWLIHRDGKILPIPPIPRKGRGWTAYEEGKFLEDGPKNAALTAPHAICLAAWRLCEKQEDNDE